MNAAAVFLIVVGTSQYQYDDHMFGLYGNTSSFVLVDDSGFFPSVQDNFIVHNIGRTSVQAELWYGDEVQWFGVVCGATINPGEGKMLDNGGKPYYYTGLKIINNNHNNERAIVHAEGGIVYSPYTPGANFDMFKNLRYAFELAVKYIDTDNSDIFKNLIGAFWPDQSIDVWSKILYQINPLFNSEITEIIQNVIDNKLNVLKSKIENLSNEIKVNASYMSIASEMVGLEEEVLFYNRSKYEFKQLNAYILPIYSNIISMKLHFYLFGVQNKDKIGLSDIQVLLILSYAFRMYDNACKHIVQVSEGMEHYAYNTSEAPNIFNNMMTIRSHLAIHGSEYIPIWKYKLTNYSDNSQIYNPVISYSTFFGRPTVNLYAQSTPVRVPPPLNALTDSERSPLTGMTIHLWSDNSLIDRIGGAELYFDNDFPYMMGTKTNKTEYFDLRYKQITHLSVFGDGRIDGLTFYLPQAESKSFGKVDSEVTSDFYLPGHYIRSFYLSSDDTDLKGQAANIAVSYQWYVDNR